MLSQANFFVEESKVPPEVIAEPSVNGQDNSPEKIHVFNIIYRGSRKEEFALRAGLFIYKDYPHHVRLINPIPLYIYSGSTRFNRFLRLISNRMGIHWNQESQKSFIEISQARIRSDGDWSNTYKATIAELYEGARIKKNNSIEHFYKRNGALLGERKNLIRGENEASPRQHYICCLFDLKNTEESRNLVLYTYLLSRLRPIYYGYTREKTFLDKNLLK